MAENSLITTYQELYQQSIEQPDVFWARAAERLDWYRRWDTVCGGGVGPVARWFVGGELNACYNCVDRHVASGHGDQAAIIYESPVTQTSRQVSYTELQHQTMQIGGAIRSLGVTKGDRVLIYMPNSVEAVIAMLACARIGAIHSVVFGGFAPRELAARIDDATPALVIAASCGIEGARILPYQPILNEAFALAEHCPANTIYWQRPRSLADLSPENLHDWHTIREHAKPAQCVAVASTDPLYILYTSGTTGNPKGIVRDTGGYLAALAWSMDGIYDCPPGSTYWAASDVGWVVGHSYMVYAPLINRNTTVVFEGKPVGTPDAGIFWKLIARHQVRTLFTAPTAIRAIKQVDPVGKLRQGYDLSSLSAIFLAGERTDPATLEWLDRLLAKPVIDHWWQTETGWAICANPLGVETLPMKAGSTSVPMPGWQIECLNSAGAPVKAGETGAIVARLPLPPGAAPTLWNADIRYAEAYLERFPGYYLSGDSGYIDVDGHVFVMSRIDDVINVAGHRLSSSAIEEVLAAHPAVAECAVIGATDELKGQVPIGFVVLKIGEAGNVEDLSASLIASVRKAIGPVAAFREVHVMAKLPKTRSGKILRRTIRQIVDGEVPQIPATIEDISVLDQYRIQFPSG